MRKPILLAAVILSLGSGAHAQTAEETVGFLLYGLEDGRTIDHDGTTIKITESSQSPAAFHLVRAPDGEGMTDVSIEKVSDCKYSVKWKSTWKISSGEFAVDFANFTNFNRFDQFSALQFKGDCAVSGNGKCSNSWMVPPGHQASNERSDAAMAYFKRTYCAGSAF